MVVRFGLLLTAVVLVVGLVWAGWGWFVEWGDRESFPLTAGVFAVVSLSVIWLAVLCLNVVERAVRLIAGSRRY